MRSSRTVCLLPMALLCLLPDTSQAQSARNSSGAPALSVHNQKQSFARAATDTFLPTSEPGIREVIANKYKKRYEEWKAEFVSTEIGRAQWDAYAGSTQFVLTIVISDENSHGETPANGAVGVLTTPITATFSEAANAATVTTSTVQLRDSSNTLIAATVTLGNKIYAGYPDPVYYPVMSALAPENSSYGLGGSILAATKIAHEFGHLNRMANTQASIYQLQRQLVPVYNSILLSNGRNPHDPRLLELSLKMGGTPVELWEDREYWGEVNAMRFLRDRLETGGHQCSVFNKIKEYVRLYAQAYEKRFAEVAASGSTPHSCSWQ